MTPVYEALSARLTSGRPLLLGGDAAASLRARGVALEEDGGVGKAVREQADVAASHYDVEVRAGVDVVSTLTSDTTPRALALAGMAFRSAALTSRAVDRALEAAERAGRPVGVAGVLVKGFAAEGEDELDLHAARLVAAGADLVLVRARSAPDDVVAAARAALATHVPVWAALDVDDGTDLRWLVARASELQALGAAALLVRSASSAAIRRAIDALRGDVDAPLGVLLDAGPGCREGYAEGGANPEEWAREMVALTSLEPRLMGGGRGCTYEHTAALSQALRRAMPSVAPPPMP